MWGRGLSPVPDKKGFDFTNEDIMGVYGNWNYKVHDSILHDRNEQALKLTDFMSKAGEFILQSDPQNGVSKLRNLIADTGRKMNITNIERYFPIDQPVDISQGPQAAGATPPTPGLPMSPAQPGQPPAGHPAPSA